MPMPMARAPAAHQFPAPRTMKKAAGSAAFSTVSVVYGAYWPSTSLSVSLSTLSPTTLKLSSSWTSTWLPSSRVTSTS